MSVAWYHKERRAAIQHYGGQCACCGESEPKFLALDHVNGGGSKHRRENDDGSPRNSTRGGYGMVAWAKRNGYPATLRVLCHNCNWATAHGRVCPHQLAREVSA